MTEMRYRINSVTSESQRYPAGNLMLNQEGWQSQINGSYPQSLTIQFYIPINTKKMHILFHQYKIPKLIEIFVKLGGRAHYRKLGHVIPTDNSQSSFEQKQQKTLYFQYPCTHIRFVIHQNYKNDMNIFNQIAIDDLIVVGDVLSHKEIAGIDLTEEQSSQDQAVQSIQISHNQRTLGDHILPQKKQAPKNQLNNSLSPLFKDIYDKLQTKKEEAVAREDYGKASSLKNILLNFYNLEKEIVRLQQQKSAALENEDYDKCQRIKIEINKKKEVVMYQRDELLRDEEQFFSHNFYSRVPQKQISPINESKRKDNSPKDINKYKSPQSQRVIQIPQSTNNNSNYVNPHDERVLPALVNKGKQNVQNLPLETNEKRKDIFVEVNESAIPEQVETQFSSVKKQYQGRLQTQRETDMAVGNESNVIKILPLEQKFKLKVQHYFDFLPQKLWQYCQNKNWKAKLKVLEILKEKIHQVETKQQFMGFFEMISRIIVSKQAVISIDCLQLLSKLTEMRIRFTLQHLPYFVEEVILEVLNFLNDTNSKIRELAYTTYFQLPNISFLSLSVVIRELIKHKNKVKNDPKLAINKIHLMTHIVENYKEAQYNFKQIMNWLIQFLEDPNHKVRSTAGELLVAISFLVGTQKILKAVEDMKRPELLEVALNIMNSSLDHSKANMQYSKISNQNSRLHQQFYGAQVANKSNKPSPHKVPQVQPIYGNLSDNRQKLEQSKNSKKESDNANFQLSYSRQSMYEESLEQSNFNQLEKDGQIRVLQAENDEVSAIQEDNVCTYCGSVYQDEKNHFISECKVLAHCEQCNSLVYLRDFTHHLLEQCENSSQFRKCKKCGLAFPMQQINGHVAKDICRKMKGVNWQRCQFCCADVMGQDQFWIKHAHECQMLPDRGNFKHEEFQSQNDES